MSAPLDTLLDRVDWQPLPTETDNGDGLPHATHKGVLTIGAVKLECYVLNDGRRVFMGDTIERILDGLRDGY